MAAKVCAFCFGWHAAQGLTDRTSVCSGSEGTRLIQTSLMQTKFSKQRVWNVDGVSATRAQPEAITDPSSPAAEEADTVAQTEATEALCRCAQSGGTVPPVEPNLAQAGLMALLAEMRRSLRIFVYPTDDAACKAKKQSQRGYAVEQAIFHRLERSALRVAEPVDASSFYLPTFTACWCKTHPGSYDECSRYVSQRLHAVVEQVAQQNPFFLERDGRNHFWVSTHDISKSEAVCDGSCTHAKVNRSLEALARHSSALVNSAEVVKEDTSSPFAFNSSRDVSLVAAIDLSLEKLGRKKVRDAAKSRRYAVFFAGQLHDQPARDLAIKSIKALANYNGTLSGKGHLKGRAFPAPWGHNLLSTKKISAGAYKEALADADLCLAPRGYAVWSPRLFEAIWFGCVPVIIADNYHLPGMCYFDWHKFAIFIAEKDANRTGDILLEWRRDPSRLLEARKQLLNIRKHLMWGGWSGDAFEMTMLDVFMKQQRKCATS